MARKQFSKSKGNNSLPLGQVDSKPVQRSALLKKAGTLLDSDMPATRLSKNRKSCTKVDSHTGRILAQSTADHGSNYRKTVSFIDP